MTFEADNQILYLAVSLSAGYLSGAVTFAFDLLSHVKNTYIKGSLYIIRAVLLAACFCAFRFFYSFGNIKWYMIACFALGFLLYIKTFAKIIAKFGERVYNKVKIKLFKWRDKRRKRANVTREKKKNSRRRNRVDGSVVIYSYRGNDLSDGNHQRKKAKVGRFKRANKAT